MTQRGIHIRAAGEALGLIFPAGMAVHTVAERLRGLGYRLGTDLRGRLIARPGKGRRA